MQSTTTTMENEQVLGGLTAVRGEKEEKAPSSRRKWGGLVVLSLALAIIVIDTTLLNVSLTDIIRDLKTDIQSLQWVITGYSLTLAALTITGGRMGDIFGKKKMFMLGAILFAVGSLVASFATNFPTLLVGEALIEGIGAALMMPATSSLLVANFQGRDRAIAFGVWGGIAAASSAIGPILGGFLATYYSWRWGFRINVFVTILLLIGSVLIVDKAPRKKIKIDWLGVLFSSVGMLGVVFAFIESTTYGWWTSKLPFVIGGTTLDLGGLSIVPISLTLGVVILGIFVLWEIFVENSGRTPLLSMKLFTNRQFTSAIVTVGVMALGQSGIVFTIPVFLQSVRGLDALATGLALLPMSITMLISSPLSAMLSKKVSPKHLIQVGLLLNVVGMIILRFSFNVNADAWTFAPGLMVYAFGMGMIMSQVNNIAMSAVPAKDAGEASGVNSTIRQVGGSLGSAIIGAVLISSLGANLNTGIADYNGVPQQLKPYLEKNIATQTSNIEFNGGPQFSVKLPDEVMSDIKVISNQAITDGNKNALIYAIAFAVLGFFVSFLLPDVVNLGGAPSDQPKEAH